MMGFLVANIFVSSGRIKGCRSFVLKTTCVRRFVKVRLILCHPSGARILDSGRLPTACAVGYEYGRRLRRIRRIVVGWFYFGHTGSFSTVAVISGTRLYFFRRLFNAGSVSALIFRQRARSFCKAMHDGLTFSMIDFAGRMSPL